MDGHIVRCDGKTDEVYCLGMVKGKAALTGEYWGTMMAISYQIEFPDESDNFFYHHEQRWHKNKKNTSNRFCGWKTAPVDT